MWWPPAQLVSVRLCRCNICKCTCNQLRYLCCEIFAQINNIDTALTEITDGCKRPGYRPLTHFCNFLKVQRHSTLQIKSIILANTYKNDNFCSVCKLKVSNMFILIYSDHTKRFSATRLSVHFYMSGRTLFHHIPFCHVF